MRRPGVLAILATVGVLVGAAGCTTNDAMSDSSSDGAGGTMLATAFPLTSVLVATESSLPADVSIGGIPMDARWLPGNRIEVPVGRDGTDAVLTVTVLPERESCAAQSEVLTPAEADSVAQSVCAIWESEGRLPVVVPDPNAPIETDPSDAAR